jgi:hypothetical protein
MVSTDPFIWLAALITLGIMSMYFKEQDFSRWAEYMVIGGTGANLVLANTQRIQGYIVEMTQGGHYLYALWILFSLLLFTKFFLPVRFRYLERYALACVFGVNMGLNLATDVRVNLAYQIRDSIQPITGVDPTIAFYNVCNFLFVFTILCYMTFTTGLGGSLGKQVSGILQTIGKPGRLVLIAGLAAGYFNIYLGRIGQISGNIWFLLHDWLQIA